MKLIRTILINLLIVVLLLIASASIYFANSFGYPVYADSAPSGYSPVTSDAELAQSFNDYCKSRDANFTSSMPGATYTYIYNYMKKGASYLGYNIDEIQEGLYKSYNDSGTIGKWYMTTQTIDFYNRLFAYFINENELEVGDTADVELYNGFVFTDDNNNSCLCTIVTRSYGSSSGYIQSVDNIKKLGTPFIYDGSSLFSNNLTEVSFVKAGLNYKFTLYRNSSGVSLLSSLANYMFIYKTDGTQNGFLTIFYNESDHNLYYGSVNTITSETYNGFHGGRMYSNIIQQGGAQQSNITFVTIDNKTINNNTYEGDTVITNEGDVINEGDTTINYNPYPDGGGTVTPPGSSGGSGSGGTINFPDIDLDLPSIDWSIGDLSSKFPFSIPFDLLAFFTVLNAEPETPEIHGTLNLSIINYQFDFDLHDFDDLASLLRNLEFIGFCIGLILITRNMLRV